MSGQTDRQADRQIVVFRLAEQQYGMDIGRVYEIIRAEAAVRLPAMPSYVEGVIHLREHVIPVVDLTARLGLPPAGPDGGDRIVIVDACGGMVGLKVDAVQEVRMLPGGSLQPPPGTFSGRGAESWVEGIALSGDQLIVMLNTDQICGLDEAALRALPGAQEVASLV